MFRHDPLVAVGHWQATEVLVRRTLVLSQTRLISTTVYETQWHTTSFVMDDESSWPHLECERANFPRPCAASLQPCDDCNTGPDPHLLPMTSQLNQPCLWCRRPCLLSSVYAIGLLQRINGRIKSNTHWSIKVVMSRLQQFFVRMWRSSFREPEHSDAPCLPCQ